MIIISNIGWSSGLRDWILQRFSAIYMSFYVSFIFSYLFFTNNFSYANWLILFSSFYFKIITIIFIFTLILHASIGMNIIITDYIKYSFLRIVFDFFVNIILLSYIFFTMQILWGFK